MAKEVVIGEYPALKNQVAMGLYDFDRSIIAITDAPHLTQAAMVLEAVLLQIINAIPVHGSQVFFYEYTANNLFNELKHLFAATNQQLGSQIFNIRAAGQKLSELNELVLRRYSLLAAAQLNSIFEYNQKQRRAEPVIFFVVSGISALLQSDTALMQDFRHVAEKGAKVGIFLMILHDIDATKLLGMQDQQEKLLYSTLTAIAPQMLGFNFFASIIPYGMDERYLKFIVDFGFSPAFKIDFLKNEVKKILNSRTVSTNQNSDKDFLSVKVGESQTKDIYFSLGPASDCYFSMISGGAGSGKSTFLYEVLLSICESQEPEDVQIILVDFLEVTFKPFSQVLEHIPYVYTDISDEDSLLNLFNYIEAESNRRQKIFSDFQMKSGGIVNRIDHYRKRSGEKLPLILLVIDELQNVFLSKNYSLKNAASRFLNLVANQARKFGIYIILSTQSFAGIKHEIEDFFTNSRLRIGLRPNKEQDFHAVMGQYNEGYKKISKRQAILNMDSGLPDANILVDLNDLQESLVEDRLRSLKAKWPKKGTSDIERYIMSHSQKIPPNIPSGSTVSNTMPNSQNINNLTDVEHDALAEIAASMAAAGIVS